MPLPYLLPFVILKAGERKIIDVIYLCTKNRVIRCKYTQHTAKFCLNSNKINDFVHYIHLLTQMAKWNPTK